MKRLPDKQIESLYTAMAKAASHGDSTFEPWYNSVGLTPSIIEFPSSILAMPDVAHSIEGYLVAWKWRGLIHPLVAMDKSDRFACQGIERKVSIREPLSTALLIWASLPDKMRQIRCNGLPSF